MRFFAKLIALWLFPAYVCAQEGAGTLIMENSMTTIAPNSIKQVFAERLYFGPNADWRVDGVLEVWCKEIWIAPDAEITGQGRIILYNPGTNPYYPEAQGSVTTIDGNDGSFIDLILEHSNHQGIRLADLEDPGFAVVTPSGADAARLNLGSNLILQENGSNVLLNGQRLGIGPEGAIQNYGPSRMVITDNLVQSQLIKVFSGPGQFVFPLGIGRNDYTPVHIAVTKQNNSFNQQRSVYASVVDEVNSDIRLQYPDYSIKRGWNVFSPGGLNVDLVLDHGGQAEGVSYQDQNASIIQYQGAQRFNFMSTQLKGPQLHETAGVTLARKATDYAAWYTKYAGIEEGIHIPNAITPNGDGINDRFVIGGLAAFDQVDLVIFNRWGNVLYSNKNYDNSWDGQGHSGGTYFYIIDARKGDITRQYKGWVLLHKTN